MRPEVLQPLTTTLETVAASGLEQFHVEALWSGDAVETEEEVSFAELLAYVRAGRLGTRARYSVRLGT
jgi:hypothetical protein